ncbi:MAG: glycosyltransferase [Burkholderiales bacterium]|nr:glycosyltransferase [Burkholderiales bacterium]MCZ2135896.1 glycosyltransferase [Burkholderiales bacterium]
MKISVVTAVFNRVATVSDSLRSSVAQRHRPVERIVIDGGSTDGTVAAVQGFGEAVAVLVSEPDRGIYDALNKGVALATGEVVGFLHADDMFNDDEALARVAAALADPNVAAVYGDLVYVSRGERSHVVRDWRAGEFSAAKLRHGWMPPHPTLYVRRAVFESVGRFDTTLRIAADYDWMLRLLLAGHRVAHIPAVQVRMRTGGVSNRSVGNVLRKSGEDFLALRRNGFGAVAAATTLTAKNLRKLPQLLPRG